MFCFQEARRIEREKEMEIIKQHAAERRARQQEEAKRRKEEAEKKKKEREASRRAMINPLAFKGTGMSVRCIGVRTCERTLRPRNPPPPHTHFIRAGYYDPSTVNLL